MPIHVVSRGEHATSIAHQYRFRNYETVWNAADNEALGATRNPNVLAEGDRVAIPERRAKSEQAATGARHTFVVDTSPLRLEVVLDLRWFDAGLHPEHRIVVDTGEKGAESGGDGASLECVLQPISSHANLSVGEIVDVEARIGFLEPVDLERGWRARLHNLGYLRAEDTTDVRDLGAAIEEFQCDESLTVNGVMDAATRAKLLAIHRV